MRKSMMFRSFVSFVLVGALLAAAGCGSKGSSGSSTAKLRLANATQSSSLSMNAVGVTDTSVTLASGTVASGGVSAYQSGKAQSYTVGVSATDGSLTATTSTLGLAANTSYTLLAFDRLGQANTYVLYDTQVTPSSGFTSLAIANAAGDAGTLDVYLVAPGTSLVSASPAFTSVSAKTTTSVQSFTSGTYDIVVTATGKPTDVRLKIPGATLASADMLTLALTSTLSGGLVNGAVVHQAAGLNKYPVTFSRVRLVGAFAAGATSNHVVALSFNGNPPVLTVTAPSASLYASVAANTSVYSVTVDGTVVANLPSATFANGGDYTIVAYPNETTSVPTVFVLQDANQPASSGAANVRLINACAGSGPVTLTDNGVSVAEGITYGTTSTYSPVSYSATSQLALTSPVQAFVPPPASTYNILGGGVYTMFVLGAAAQPVVVFAKDR